ncbi:MAG TPA: phage protease, partial [Candidatus Bathyarchaeia archaeon]|nr:phage protease [Candidatus Bathyarchaeia archaeon]
TPELGQKFKEHFDNNTYGQELQVNYEHGYDVAKGNKAAGWVQDIEPRDDGVYYKVKFTEPALAEIKAGEWKYLSPEYNDWTNPETGEKHADVPRGLGLSNRPFFKGMASLNFSAFFTEIEEEEPKEFAEWSTAYKNDLPDSAFMYIEQGGTKDSEGKTMPRSKRHFPYKDASGKIDRIHLEKVAQLVPKSNLPPAVKTAVANKARRIAGGDNPKENAEVNEELKKFAERLGIKITDESSDESVLAEAFSVIEPLMEVKKEGDKIKTFREDYPEEFERMQRLESLRVEQDARKFAEQFSRFPKVKEVEKEDGTKETVVENSTKGFSAVALNAIEEAHKKFAEGSGSSADLKGLLDVLSSDSAVVDYKETGSSREPETT